MRSSPAGTDAGGTRHGRRLGARSEQQPTRPPAQLSVGLEKSAALTQTQKHRSRDCDGVDDRLGTQQFRLRDRVVRRCRCRVLHGGAGGRGRDIRVERDQGGAAGGEGAGASSRPTWPRRTRRFATASGALGPPPRVGARRRTPIAVASQDSEHAGNQQQSNPREIGNTAGTGPHAAAPDASAAALLQIRMGVAVASAAPTCFTSSSRLGSFLRRMRRLGRVLCRSVDG